MKDERETGFGNTWIIHQIRRDLCNMLYFMRTALYYIQDQENQSCGFRN